MRAITVVSLALAMAACPAVSRAGISAVVINEVLANPLDEDTGEFVELHNWGQEPVDLAGWRLADAADTNDVIIDFTGPRDWGRPGTVIPPGGFALIVDPEYAGEYGPFLEAQADPDASLVLTIGLDTTIGNGLTNAGDLVRLSDGAGVSAAFRWSSDPGQGISWEKIEAQLGDGETNWASCVHPHKSTPGARNSVSRAQDDVSIPADGLRFRPPCPRPGQEVEIEAPVHNQGRRPAQGVEVLFFRDADGDSALDEGEQIGSAQRIDGHIPPQGIVSARQLWLPPTPGSHLLGACAGYPPDQDPADNLAVAGIQVRFVPGTVVVNEIMYDPAPTGEDSEKEPEWVEIFHRGAMPLDLALWTVEDSRGEPHLLCDTTQTFAPGDYAVIASGSPEAFQRAYSRVPGIVLFPVGSLPSLNNAEDLVLLRDPAGTVVDSVLYEDQWGGGGGISVERINPHLDSNDPLNWNWCVHPGGATPGEKNSIYTPVVPAEANLSIEPNPFSPDGDGHQEITVISYRLPSSAARLNLRLFDIRGKLVRTLVDQERCASAGEALWDGRGDSGEGLKMGIYIIHMEALDDRRGMVCREKKTVVLAGRLN